LPFTQRIRYVAKKKIMVREHKLFVTKQPARLKNILNQNNYNGISHPPRTPVNCSVKAFAE
jgi:hypothetical protein